MAVCRILFNAYKHVFVTKTSVNGGVVMWPYIESVKGKNYKEVIFCLSWMLSECGAMSGVGFNIHI
jgi:hypothetical protein